MPYFETADLRALPDMADAGRFDNDRLEAAHDWIAQIIERECDTTFVPTETTETLTGSGTDALFLSAPYVLSVDSVAVNGDTVDVDDLYVDSGAIYYIAGSRWSCEARRNVTVTYTAGYPGGVPADLKEAAMRGARNWLLTSDAWSGKDSRTTAITNEYGNYQLSVAGDGRPTGLPDVDATIMAWARRVRVPKVS